MQQRMWCDAMSHIAIKEGEFNVGKRFEEQLGEEGTNQELLGSIK